MLRVTQWVDGRIGFLTLSVKPMPLFPFLQHSEACSAVHLVVSQACWLSGELLPGRACVWLLVLSRAPGSMHMLHGCDNDWVTYHLTAKFRRNAMQAGMVFSQEGSRRRGLGRGLESEGEMSRWKCRKLRVEAPIPRQGCYTGSLLCLRLSPPSSLLTTPRVTIPQILTWPHPVSTQCHHLLEHIRESNHSQPYHLFCLLFIGFTKTLISN